VYALLRAAIRDDNPVLLFEHKALYGRKSVVIRDDASIAVVGKASVERPGTDVTVLSTMLMTDRSLQAAELLAAEGIDAEVIDLRWLRRLDFDTVRASVEKTRRLVIVEEQVHAGGWGATTISRLAMEGMPTEHPPHAVSVPDDLLVPYSPPLEDAVLPSVTAIADALRTVAH
jgi:acetoin:2,6-dichlorophenolindophenol oxidoreductase subunit beta